MMQLYEEFLEPTEIIKVHNDDIIKDKFDTNRIGIARGQKLYADDYDFDEMNPEIAKMFGVVG